MSDEAIAEISLGIDQIHCSDQEKQLLHFAIRASKKDNYKIVKEEIDTIKQSGYSDQEILEAITLVGYFNYINTLSNVFGLGTK